MAHETKECKYKRHAQKAQNAVAGSVNRGNPNVIHQLKLLKAERNVLTQNRWKWKKNSRTLTVLRLYKESIALATQDGFIHDCALANERAGYFCWDHLRDANEATKYWDAATQKYSEWGANYKVQQMLQKIAGIS